MEKTNLVQIGAIEGNSVTITRPTRLLQAFDAESRHTCLIEYATISMSGDPFFSFRFHTPTSAGERVVLR